MQFIRRVLAVTAILVSCNAAIMPARAAPLDAKGEELKTILSGLLEYEKSAQSLGGNRLETKGDVTVEKKEGYYAAALPTLSFYSATNTRVDISSIGINAIPEADPNRWKMAVSMPSGFTASDAQGAPTTKTTIGTQRFNGIWDTTLNHFVMIDAQYGKIGVVDLKNNFSTMIDSATAKLDAKQGPDGSWGGPFNLTLSRLELGSAQKAAVGKIGQVDISSTFSGYTAKDAKIVKDKIIESGKAASAAQAAGQKTQPSLGFIADLLENGGDDMTTSMAIKDIEFTTPGDGKTLPTSFKLGQVGFNFNVNGLRSDAAKVAFGLNYKDLSITPPPASTGFASIVPSTIDIGFEVNGLPAKELAAQKDPGGAIQNLQASNTNLTINAFRIVNADYLVDFTGALKNNPALAGTAVGDINGKIKGLQSVITKLSALAQSLPQDQQGKAMMVMMPLSMVDSMGKADPADATTKTYAIKIGADGTTTVNGVALGGPKPAKAAQTQQQPPMAVKAQ